MEDTDPQVISCPPQNNNNFLYKAILLSISLLLLPFFSSGDFMISTSVATCWELLQLVFVGIAVSYGLFSTKQNHVPPPPLPPHDETTHKQDDAQSYVARLFQSSSLFDHDRDHDHDDDFEIKPPLSKEKNTSKVWNSQYYRGEPIVVVANKEPSSSSSSVIDDGDIVASSRLVSKVDTSNSTRKFKLSQEDEEENDISVLRSPIPWRSRSARNMEVTPPAAAAAALPSNPSVLHVRSKSFQDYGRKKVTSPPIPPPPPPPPPPLPLNGINKKSFTRNYMHNNRGTRRSTTLSSPKPFRTTNQTRQQEDEVEDEDNYLSHDQEIESFIETRGGKFIIPNPKQQQQEEDDKKKKKKEITDTEDDDDDDELHELASKTSNGNGNGNENGNGVEIMGPDVDKKADEFIAKFREQIRLQRIASIRTSTQIHKNNIY